jgi:hypothetical protein
MEICRLWIVPSNKCNHHRLKDTELQFSIISLAGAIQKLKNRQADECQVKARNV